MEEALDRTPDGETTASPGSLSAAARLPSGQTLVLRPLRPDDRLLLGEYFLGLSETTRGLYGPHPFDAATADAICDRLDPAQTLRMVATVRRAEGERIVAYFLLTRGPREDDAARYAKLGIPLGPGDGALAPSVVDDFQDQGVGSRMMSHLLWVAPGLGLRRIVLWGGVQARNARGIHFYTKWGFRKVGEFFTDKNNHDMILDLASLEPAKHDAAGEEALRQQEREEHR